MARLCSSRFERAARQLGWTRIAGIDEAGRGALFGPVVAAAVILNPRRRIVGLAASILAKTHRDTRMDEWDGVYPGYGFAQHKGYGTPEHLEALKRLGPTPLHRHSFAPVREAGCWSTGATQTPLPIF